MGKKKPTIDATMYYMSIHLGICHKVDRLRSIFIGERKAWEGDVSIEQGIYIDNQELFGGIRKEGGVSGQAYFLPGGPTQILPENLCNRLGLTQATTPGFRGISSLFFVADLVSSLGFYWTANQPTLRGVWAKVTRQPTTLGLDFSQIGEDANPAHIIHECLVDRDWGMGADPASLDLAAFQYAAETLFNEGLGLSLMWAQQSSIEDFIKEVIDHINATLYINPRTGLFTIKLIRDDYVTASLPVFNEDNCVVSSYQKKSWGETTNEIVVTWTNPENEQEETVSLQDLANFSIQGNLVSDSRNYYGVRNASLAKNLCARDLRVASAPLTSVELEVNRDAWDLVPGDVFVLQYADYGVESMVIRVGTIDYGRDGEPTIKVSGVEDIFSLPFTDYAEPPQTGWVDPSEDPQPMAFSYLLTLPYFFVAANLDSAELSSFTYPEAYVSILAAQTGQDTFSFDLLGQDFDNLGNPVVTSLGQKNCVGRAVLSTVLTRQATSSITSFSNLSGILFPNSNVFMVIPGTSEQESEICLISNYNGVSYTLFRGVLDTVPKTWPLGTEVFFFEKDSNTVDTTTLSAFETSLYKLLSITSKGILPEASAPLESVIVSERPHLPQRPANCQVEGVRYTSVNISPLSDLDLAWSTRNRLSENSIILNWEDSSVTPESGQLTRITLLSTTLSVIYQQDYTGSNAVIPHANFTGYTQFIVRFSSVLSGEVSLQHYDIAVTVS